MGWREAGVAELALCDAAPSPPSPLSSLSPLLPLLPPPPPPSAPHLISLAAYRPMRSPSAAAALSSQSPCTHEAHERIVCASVDVPPPLGWAGLQHDRTNHCCAHTRTRATHLAALRQGDGARLESVELVENPPHRHQGDKVKGLPILQRRQESKQAGGRHRVCCVCGVAAGGGGGGGWLRAKNGERAATGSPTLLAKASACRHRPRTPACVHGAAAHLVLLLLW